VTGNWIHLQYFVLVYCHWGTLASRTEGLGQERFLMGHELSQVNWNVLNGLLNADSVT